MLDADGLPVDYSRSWCMSMGTAFHRLCPLLPTDIELDEKEDQILVDLLWGTMAYMHGKKSEIETLRETLVD